MVSTAMCHAHSNCSCHCRRAAQTVSKMIPRKLNFEQRGFLVQRQIQRPLASRKGKSAKRNRLSGFVPLLWQDNVDPVRFGIVSFKRDS